MAPFGALSRLEVSIALTRGWRLFVVGHLNQINTINYRKQYCTVKRKWRHSAPEADWKVPIRGERLVEVCRFIQ